MNKISNIPSSVKRAIPAFAETIMRMFPASEKSYKLKLRQYSISIEQIEYMRWIWVVQHHGKHLNNFKERFTTTCELAFSKALNCYYEHYYTLNKHKYELPRYRNRVSETQGSAIPTEEGCAAGMDRKLKSMCECNFTEGRKNVEQCN